MNTKLALVPTVFAVSVAFLAGCPADDQEVTLAEAQQAVEESTVASDASNLAEGTIELTTHFTLGGAIEDAAEELRGYVATELPCAEVTRSAGTLTIEYGVNGECLWHGRKITGTHSVTVSRTDENDVLVHHEWIDMSNGRVQVSGNADVTWDLDAKTRHVVHELDWTRLKDGRTGTGTGDRTQSPLDGDWSNGIVIDGERAWDGDKGHWGLTIDEVAWRWEDPVPESGSYHIATPANKELVLTFSRVDEDTIHVVVDGAKRDFEFDVSKAGDVSE